jgi:thiol:disulfide interchange protein DsbA
MKKMIKLIGGICLVLTGSVALAQLALPSAPSPALNAGTNQVTASPREGVDFRVLPVAQPTESKGKIEVIEFFWYGCPHCSEFDPDLQAWVKKQSKDVVFKRVPIAFREDFLPHSQMFYAFEAIGKGDAYTAKVLNAIHVEHKSLLKENEISDWVASQGIDAKAFMKAYNSFGVITKAKAANKIGEAYRIDGVPTVAIQGKYETSPSIAGTKAKALSTMDYLVARARKEK